MVVWNHFLVPWILFHGCLVTVYGCLDSLSGVLDLVPLLCEGSWLPGEGFWLPGESSGSLYLVGWLPGEGSRRPGFSSWFSGLSICGCLVRVPGCLDSLPGLLDFPACLVKVPGCLDSLLVSYKFQNDCQVKVSGCLGLIYGCLVKVPCCLDTLSGSLDLVPWWPGQGSSLPGFISRIPDFVPWLSGQGSWLPAFTFRFHRLCSMVASWRFLVAWIQFLDPWTWFHGCLVVAVCQNSLSGFLNLVPWPPGEDSRLSRFSSCFPGLRSMVAWWRFLVAWIRFLVLWTWFHHYLVKVPGCLVSLPCSHNLVPACLDSVLASLDLVPRLSGEGSFLTGFTSWVPWLDSMTVQYRIMVA